ncbi:beta strand repeat-containing protein [Sphingomonas abietis]|uniref:Autotransporter domain-containing protein n=1 Tax=Sphingomonas abietis TaxID=3012344 RepID=A0ABY7NMM2_9SPHN|nr:hypothetical protein [Sphingomonas abietis]WBO21736.1 hypothetical protein PBT88_16415 [Sphingomonas abietis]
MTPADTFATHMRAEPVGRAAAQRLRLGASMGALAALLCAAPTFAQTSQACGAPVDGVVTCAPDAGNFPDGISYEVAAPAPQDLTVVVPAETVITPTSDDRAGISVTSSGGAITVSAADSSIQASGVGGRGIDTRTAGGNVSIDAGSVYTSGYRADGIAADAGMGGDIHISAQTVTTAGEASTGVRANTAVGNIDIHTGGVVTSGLGSDGIYAATTAGDTTIDTTYAYAFGGSGRGIVAYSSGTTTVRAETVGTQGGGMGTEADATGITAVGTAVNVEVTGSVRTTGDYAAGVIARTNHVYSDPTIVPSISVTADTVATNGLYSDGIDALNYADGGATKVTAGTVSTHGDMSHGIYAGGQSDVLVDAGAVSTTGTGSQAIRAVSFGGNIIVDAGSVSTSGAGSHGIYAINYGEGAVTVNAGSVKTRRDYSIGIGALSLGDVKVDAGKVETSGFGSQGIVAYSVFGTVDVNAGSVSTTGGNATGIGGYAFAAGKAVHLTGGSVDTRGDYAVGMLALAANGTAIVDATGTISTSGAHSEGIAASGISLDGGDAVIIKAGSVSTTGGGARGISAQGSSGNVTIEVDSVKTSGGLGGGRHSTWAEGILASSYDGLLSIKAGSVDTTGNGAVGIDTTVSHGEQVIDVDSVTTTGGHAPGVFTAAEEGKTTIRAGSITTTGDYSQGILAQSFLRDPYTQTDRSITISAGAIATSGASSDGIYAFGADNVSIDAGTITTSGANAVGVYAVGVYGDVGIKVDSVSTAGDYAPAVFALAPYGNVSVEAGSVSTSGQMSDGIRAGGLNAAVKAGSVDVSGYGSRAIDVLAANGAANVEAGTITGSGTNNIGVLLTGIGGASTVKVDTIKLSGYGSTGIVAFTEGGGSVDVSAGKIEVGQAGAAISAGAYGGNATVTVGSVVSGGSGISATAGNGDVTVTSGAISTTGSFGKGIYTNANGGQSTITLSGNLTTTGEKGFGIQATTVGGDNLIDNQKIISTAGTYAYGIIGNSLVGNVRINGGTVTTSGYHASAINATAVGPYSTVTVVADKVTTSGAKADGIFAQSPLDVSIPFRVHLSANAVPLAPADGTPDHTVSVTSGTVKVTGAGSVGIRVRAAGDAHIDATNTSAADGNAILASAYGTTAITIRGVTSSQGDAISAKGDNVTIDVGSAGTITGGGDAIVASAVGSYVPPPTQGGGGGDGGGGGIGVRTQAVAADTVPTVRITNAGTITGGSGYAIRVASGAANVSNSGTIAGRILFGAGDDVLTNSGTFAASGNSDFGDGNDRFVNSGTLRILPGTTTAGTVSFLNLERFENTGTIDLANGHAGDTFVLSGNYVGSQNARLLLEMGNGTTDHFTVTGAATGSTKISLVDLGNANAVLTGNAPISLVKVGAGSSSDAFSLATQDFGFVHYGLTFDAANGRFMLASSAGAPVFRYAKLNETVANVTNANGDALTAHLQSLRDSGAGSKALWGDFGGRTDRVRATRGGFDTGYRQNNTGGRLGYDFSAGTDKRPGFGLTAGYDSATVSFSSSASRVSIDSFDVGGYGGYRSGAFFLNGLASVAFHSLKATDRELAISDTFSGHTVGAQLEAGGRFTITRFFLEPSAKLAWSHTNLGDLKALNQTVAFENATSLRGTFGARFGGKLGGGDGPGVTFYGGVHYVHEFAGTKGAILFSGGASEEVGNDRIGDQVRGSIGLNLVTKSALSGFVEANGSTGDGRSGGGGRVGIRLGF